jgi:ATP-dependent DNA helicase RecQ
MTIHQILVKYWGYSTFRPMQEEIINSVMEGNDTLALLPTGGGKSICYQVPALAREGVCLVISPLIALMRDQVDRLKNLGIKAFAVYSGMHYSEIEVAINNAVYGDAKFLYLSPERLLSSGFSESLKLMKVSLIAVDEAHCLSQWGYDFRPPYLKIADIRPYFPNAPVLALTASATPEVIEDIQAKLHFKQSNIKRQSFERKNISYLVYEEEDKLGRLIKVLQKVPGSSIVYAGTRRKTFDIAKFLTQNGISADYYHAGLEPNKKEEKQKKWMQGSIRVIVATNAFGLGIDKPDVRLVVHVDLPNNIESYFQEAGRAGRDGNKAYAVLLYHESNLADLLKQLKDTFPELDTIKTVYQALGNYLKLALGSGKNLGFDFDINAFSLEYDFKPLIAYNSLKFLEKEGYLVLSEGMHFPAQIFMKIQGEDLYRFRVENPRFDGFVKLILRTYTGLFSQNVKINEKQLAVKAGIPLENVLTYLKNLHKLGVIIYIPQKNKPQIFFAEERLDKGDIYISKENYLHRKKAAKKRLDAVKAYVTSRNKCRSQYLLGYFGESNTKRCGHCDFCIERNKVSLNEFEFDLIVEKIKPLLKGSPMLIDELINVAAMDDEKILRVVEWLLDNDKIKYDVQKRLFWQSKS